MSRKDRKIPRLKSCGNKVNLNSNEHEFCEALYLQPLLIGMLILLVSFWGSRTTRYAIPHLAMQCTKLKGRFKIFENGLLIIYKLLIINQDILCCLPTLCIDLSCWLLSYRIHQPLVCRVVHILLCAELRWVSSG